MKKLYLIFLLALVLRFYHLDTNPPSPYWEEAAIGYDAYSILKTGKDFHGNKFPLIAFESFGDYKPSLYFYATVPAVAVLGLNTFAVRFPSAFFGSLTILLIYFLVKQLFPKPASPSQGGTKQNLALISSFFLAISPWHLQLSRVGFEANLGLFLVVLGAWLFLKSLRKPVWLIPAVSSWALSLYTYHANRIFIPLLGLAFGLFFLKKLLQKKQKSLITLVIFILLCLPLAIRLNDSAIKQRFLETSAFSTLDPIIKSNQLIKADGGGKLARFVHHRFWHYKDIFIDHYLDHFTFDFLFLSGDTNPRHSTQLVGSLYLIQLPLLLWGLLSAFRKKDKKILPLIIWLLLAPIPAGLTKATPHALRSLPMIIPLTIISAYGLAELIKSRKKVVFSLAVVFVFIILAFEFNRYLFIYHKNYPAAYSSHWQYGYKEMIDYVGKNQEKYDNIFITRELGRPSIYYWFYTQTDPREVQQLNNKVSKDQGEYLQFNNIFFGDLSPSTATNKPNLVVISPDQELLEKGALLKEIKDLNQQTAFKIYEI